MRLTFFGSGKSVGNDAKIQLKTAISQNCENGIFEIFVKHRRETWESIHKRLSEKKSPWIIAIFLFYFVFEKYFFFINYMSFFHLLWYNMCCGTFWVVSDIFFFISLIKPCNASYLAKPAWWSPEFFSKIH